MPRMVSEAMVAYAKPYEASCRMLVHLMNKPVVLLLAHLLERKAMQEASVLEILCFQHPILIASSRGYLHNIPLEGEWKKDNDGQ